MLELEQERVQVKASRYLSPLADWRYGEIFRTGDFVLWIERPCRTTEKHPAQEHDGATLGHVGCFDTRPAETLEHDIPGLWQMELERIFISPLRCASGWVTAEAFGYWWRLWQPGCRAAELQRSRPDVCMRNSSSIKHQGSGW